MVLCQKLWNFDLLYKKNQLWYYAKHYGTLIYYRKNFGTTMYTKTMDVFKQLTTIELRFTMKKKLLINYSTLGKIWNFDLLWKKTMVPYHKLELFTMQKL